MTNGPLKFQLARTLEVSELADSFARQGRVRISQFIDEAAASILQASLQAETRWRHILNGGDKVFEIPRSDFENLPPQQRSDIDTAALNAARFGFQFRYDTIRVPDEAELRGQSGSPLDLFAAFMSSAQILDLLSEIAGLAGITFADAQATSYGPGAFLTTHDDRVEGKHRHAAYVLGLTTGWRTEWGGLLLFPSEHAGTFLVPEFNSLDLFAVPQPHSVSYVSPSAPIPRISVSGWLRGAAGRSRLQP